MCIRDRLEGGLLEGFFDEVDGAALEGVHGHGHVSVARDEDDGQLGLAGQKVFLHFKTTHARHAHVKHENRNGLRVVLGDEALAAVVELDAVVAVSYTHLDVYKRQVIPP